jgi:hypothetical protein
MRNAFAFALLLMRRARRKYARGRGSAYGILYDPASSSPACQKVTWRDGTLTEVADFEDMPAHDWRRCVVSSLADRTVAYYLDPEDSTKKYDGTCRGVTSDGSAADLTGGDGDVMVHIPVTYWRVVPDYRNTGRTLYLVSNARFGGSEPHPCFYVSPDGETLRDQFVGAYHSCICDSSGAPLTTDQDASSSAGWASGRKARSVAGAKPWTGMTQANHRAAAANSGACGINALHKQFIGLMMAIEYGTFNAQAAVSRGFSDAKRWDYRYTRLSGRTNAGNGTGETRATSGTDMNPFESLKIGSATYYRYAQADAPGLYAWNSHASPATIVYTAAEHPSDGDAAYNQDETAAGTVASHSLLAEASRVISFQYRGVENPYGEVYEFEDGFQKYQAMAVTSIKAGGVVYARDEAMDGGSSYAWTSEDEATVWTTAASPSANAATYSDAACATSTGNALSINGRRFYNRGYWYTTATADYTDTPQQSAESPSYRHVSHPWPSTGHVKRFDPRTFYPVSVGGSATTYLCDYFYNSSDGGSRVGYRGGNASNGSSDGPWCVSVYYGLTYSFASIGGRLAA